MHTVANRTRKGLARGDRNLLLERGTNPKRPRRTCKYVSTGYNRVEGNRRASRNGRVSDLPTRNPSNDSQMFDRCRLKRRGAAASAQMHAQEKRTEQVYLCPVCARKYSSLDAMYLTTNQWKCEDCGVEVQRELGDTGAAGDEESFRAHQVG
jgi:hypothetical protein